MLHLWIMNRSLWSYQYTFGEYSVTLSYLVSIKISFITWDLFGRSLGILELRIHNHSGKWGMGQDKPVSFTSKPVMFDVPQLHGTMGKKNFNHHCTRQNHAMIIMVVENDPTTKSFTKRRNHESSEKYQTTFSFHPHPKIISRIKGQGGLPPINNAFGA